MSTQEAPLKVPTESPPKAQVILHPQTARISGLSDLEQIGRLVDELPDPATLPPGSWVMLSPGAPARTGGLSGFFARKPRPMKLAVRCSALLLRGYTDIRADAEGSMAFGRVERA
jgi:hypothetical protein